MPPTVVRFLLGFSLVTLAGIPAILKNIPNPVVVPNEKSRIKIVNEYEDLSKYK